MDGPRIVYLAMNWALFLGGVACLVAAAAALRGMRLPSRIPGWALATVPAAGALLKWAMFRNFQLTRDSACVIHFAWNAAHGYGLVSSLEPPSHLATHFSLLSVLLSPALWIWNSSACLAVLQGAAVGSAIPAVYLLARRGGASGEAAGLAALLAFAHPIYQGLLVTIVEDSVYAVPLFLWAVLLWKGGRWASAGLLAGLLLLTKEEAPFVLVGIAVAWMWHRDRRRRAAALLSGSVACWWAQMRVIELAQAAGDIKYSHWSYFSDLGGEHMAEYLSRHPWILPLALVTPTAKLGSAIMPLLHAGLFPLLSGTSLWMVIIPWLPHQLAEVQSAYHRMLGLYGGLVAGPFLWTMSLGLDRSFKRLPQSRHSALRAYVLLTASLGLFAASGYNRPDLLPRAWRDSVPRIAAQIPADSKLWCDGYLLPHLGLRRYVKSLPESHDPYFESQPFVPDRVVVSDYWIRLANPEAVAEIFAYLRHGNYQEVLRDHDLVLYRRGLGI